MNKLKVVYIPIYDYRFIIAVFDDDKKIEGMLAPWFRDVKINGCEAIALNRPGSIGVVFRECELTNATIAHETFHATIRLMELLQQDLQNASSHEPHAYLNGFLVQKTYETLKKWGVRIKRKSTFNWQKPTFRCKSAKCKSLSQ